ncbi:MAG: hypothetical protein ACNI26_08410 [Terasakiella sp.]|uniref:hypothetical protein n=1 Tax=unclassified Terasakiella TaxID=2614952 RepID=UPI003B00CF9F
MPSFKIGGWIIACGLYGTLAVWLFSFAPSLSNDDAYFFLRGIERFSILEFRPHFPGYPGFILLGKALYSLGLSSLNALSILSLSMALAIPLLCFLCVDKNRLAVFLCALGMPLLPYLGLSLMSDGAGIAFFLAALWQYRKGNFTISGLLLGTALACRPSFVIFAAVFICAAIFKDKKAALPFVFACATLCLLFFFGLLAIEQMPLVWEGWRFIEGHFLLWGNTTLGTSDLSWFDSFSRIPGGLVYFLALSLGLAFSLYPHRKSILAFVVVAGWTWVLLFQNPENLRHLALPLILSLILIAKTDYLINKIILYGLVVLQVFISNQINFNPPQPAPLELTRQHLLKESADKVITHHGVHYLHDRLPDSHVFDKYYPYQLDLPIWDVSTTEPSSLSEIKVFPARMMGEQSFYIHKQDLKRD